MNNFTTVSGESDINSPSGQQSTTADLTDALVNSTTIASPRDLDSRLLSTISTGYQQDIKQFLSKPFRIRTGTWTSADATGSQKAAIDLPSELIALPIYKIKCEGYLGLRATIVLRLQVNGNKFQQGRLIMSYVPQGGVTGVFPAQRTNSLTKLTQLPNVQLDLACDTESVLRIPHVAPMTHYDLLALTPSIAAAYLHVYMPLKYGTGSSSANWVLWCSLEEVELVTPTLDSQFQLQSGVDATDKELASVNKGAISGMLSKVSHIATILSGVPNLSSVAAPVSWVSAALSRTAAHFGWSKPRDESPVTRMRRYVYPYVGNSDTVDDAMPLSLKSSAKVEVLPGFAGTDMDELSINYIASRPAQYAGFTWATNTSVGTTLFNNKLGPTYYKVPNTSEGYTYYDMVPCAMLAEMFMYYRGSIKWTFKFAKTEYHSGRLLVAYAPGARSTLVPTIEDTNYLHRSVIDLREGNEFTFIFPFANTRTWLNCQASTASYNGTCWYGRVWVFVLNPLVCPDTVSSGIDCMIEVSMAEDAQFAVPNPTPYRPLLIKPVDFVPQSGYELQAGGSGSVEDPCSLTSFDNTIGSSKCSPLTIHAEKFCIGEEVKSLRHLLKKTSRLGMNGFVSTILDRANMYFRPYTIGARGVATTGGVHSISSFAGDLYSILGSMFAYNRGGVRYTISPQTANTSDIIGVYLSQCATPSTFDADSAANLVSAMGQPVASGNGQYILSRLSLEGCSRFEVPHYNMLHSRLNRISFCDNDFTVGSFGSEPLDDLSSQLIIEISPVAKTGASSQYDLYRSVADDFTFGFFLGVPSMVYGTAA